MYVQLGFDANDVANYMAKEIDYNVNSKKANEIRMIDYKIDNYRYYLKNDFRFTCENIEQKKYYLKQLADETFNKYNFFRIAVDTNSYWDHKWQLSALFPSMGLSRRFHHVYKGIDIPYDVWSNIHFGAIGRYCEVSELILLLASDGAQMGSDAMKIKRDCESDIQQYHLFTCIKNTYYKLKENGIGDTNCDQSAIKIGFAIYNEFVKNNKQVNAQNMIDDIMTNTVYKAYFDTGECKDE